MMYLQFQLDQQRYVMTTRNVVTLLPVVRIQAIPNMPEYILGVINYHGESVPVIDLARLILNRAANSYLSTRIVIVEIEINTGEKKLTGLMIEKATEVIKIQESEFKASSLTKDQAPYIRSTYADSSGIVHSISPEALLSPADRQLLFQI